MFGFFEAIYDFIIRQIGTRGDSASSVGSLHSKTRATYNLTSDTEYSVGRRTDSASRTGSLHAKIRNLDPYSKTPTMRSYQSSVSSGTPINFTGSGYITG